MNIGVDGQEYPETSMQFKPGYALFENLDVYSLINNRAQAAYFTAPLSTGTRQDVYSAFLNNVETNSSPPYFLQNGFLFEASANSVVWSDDSHNLARQRYNMPYTYGDSYYFVVNYDGTWGMCAGASSIPSSYFCQAEPLAQGTAIAGSPNTAIWVENWNQNSKQWYQGFTSKWAVTSALNCPNGVCVGWTSQHRHTTDNCSQSWPAFKAMSGSLVDGTGMFVIKYVPPYCP